MVDLLVLGTTHFQDHSKRVLSARGQAEVADVVDRLVTWAPTKVGVEVEMAPDLIDRLYAGWRSGAPLPVGEHAQIGAGTALRLGVERIHAVDVMGRFYEEDVERLTAADPSHRSAWEGLLAFIESDTADIASRLATETLHEVLLHLNGPEYLEHTLSAYFEHLLPLADELGDPGPTMVANWYARNIRIAANIARIAEPGDRLLVVFGVGHAPLLRHCLGLLPGWRLHDYGS